MKKILSSLIFCFATFFVYGQKATWNLASGSSSFNFNYNFKKATGPFVYNPGIGDASTTFLPAPPSGTARVGAGGGSTDGMPFFTLMEDGTKDSLKFNIPSVNAQARFSIYNTDGASALTSYFFTLNFNNNNNNNAINRADWILAVGNHSGTTNLFNNTSGIPSINANSSPELFGVIKFTVNTTDLQKMNITYRIKPDVATSISFQPITTGTINSQPITTIDVETNYKFEMLCNNTDAEKKYTKAGTEYTVPSRTYHLWMNETRLQKPDNGFDFPANQLAENTSLNSIVISGANGRATDNLGSNNASVIISKLSMEFANTTLPVSLVDFTGKEELGNVKLNWKTASESNNSHFEVLRSSDANITPVTLGQVNGKGNSSSLVNYNFLDNSPLVGNNYYQLRQVDFDGKSTLSKTITVKSSVANNDVIVYKGDGNGVLASINSNESTDASFTLIDIQGKVITQFNKRLNSGNNIISLHKNTLLPGIYVVKINLNGTQVVKKINY